MNKDHELDRIDKQILSILMKDANSTYAEIASQLGKKRADLIQKNNLNNPDQLKIGQKINY